MSLFQSLFPRLTTSASDQEREAFFAPNKFSYYLPWIAYDKEQDYYVLNDDSYGSIVELNPMLHAGNNTQRMYEDILSRLPRDIFGQFVYFIGNNIAEELDYYQRSKTRPTALGQRAVKKQVEFLRQKTRESLSHKMLPTCKNNRIVLALRSNNLRKLIQYREMVEKQLSSHKLYRGAMDSRTLKKVLYEYLNDSDPTEFVDYDPYAGLNTQLVKPSTVIAKVGEDMFRVNDRHWIASVATSLPYDGFNLSLFGEKLGQYMGHAIEVNQFVEKSIITLSFSSNISMKEKAMAKSRYVVANSMRSIEGIGSKLISHLKESDRVLKAFEDDKTLLRWDLTVLTSGSNKTKAQENFTRIQEYWKRGEFRMELAPIAMTQLANFIGAMPLGINEKEFRNITGYQRYNFDFEVSNFIPIEGDWRGNGHYSFFFSRRGQIVGLDIWNSGALNKNGFIIAQSGAGKSVLLQYLAWTNYMQGVDIFSFDVGESMKNLCQMMNGEWINIDPNKPLCFNPFSSLQSLKEVKTFMPWLTSFVYMLGANKDTQTADKDYKMLVPKISAAIRTLYQKPEIGQNLEITHIRDYLMRLGKEIKDQRIIDFSEHLDPFSRGGVYEEFWCGRCNVDFSNPFTVIEIKAVENDPDIRDPIINMGLFFLARRVYLQKGKKILAIIDEISTYLNKNPVLDAFIGQAYRRFRKEGAAIVAAGQSFTDIWKEDDGGENVGQTVVNNSAWTFFLEQRPTSINGIINSKLYDFDEYDKEMLSSIHTVDGEYSEIFLMTPDKNHFPVRLIVDKFFYYMSSTNDDDRKKLAQIMKTKNISIEDAIEEYIAA